MLIPLTRKTVETLIPAVATGDQYNHYWGKPQDLLKRLLISVTALIVVLVIGAATRDNEISGFCRFIFGIATGLYWFWYPIYGASLRNRTYRRYPYAGLWQGEVLDAFVTEELIGTEETVNKRGELVIVEDRERRINLEVGDESGFRTLVQAPFLRDHKTIYPGMPVQLLLLSQEKNLSRISKISDAYLPNRDLWVSDYPYLRRDTFLEVSQRVFAEVAQSADGSWVAQPIGPDRHGYVAAPADRRPRSNARPSGRRPDRAALRNEGDRDYNNRDYNNREYDDRGYAAQGSGDRDYNNREYGDRGYAAQGSGDRGYDDREYGDRGYNNRGYDDWDQSSRRPGDRPLRQPVAPASSPASGRSFDRPSGSNGSRRLDDRRYDPQDYDDMGYGEADRGYAAPEARFPGNRRPNAGANPGRNRGADRSTWGYGNDRENTAGVWDTSWNAGTQGYSAHQSSGGEVWDVSAAEPMDLSPEDPAFDRPPVQIPPIQPRRSPQSSPQSPRQPLNLRYAPPDANSEDYL